MLLALLLLCSRALATPTPTPWITPTPYVVEGKVLTMHEADYALDDSKGAYVFWTLLDEIPEVKASVGNVSLIVEDIADAPFACNLGSGSGGESRGKGGKRYFYFVSKDEKFYWDGKGGKLTVIWWD